MPASTLRPRVGDGGRRRVGRVELGHSEERLAGEEEKRKLVGRGGGVGWKRDVAVRSRRRGERRRLK